MTPQEFQRIYGTDTGNPKLMGWQNVPMNRPDNQEEWVGKHVDAPMQKGAEDLITLADLYATYVAEPFRESVVTDASPVVQKYKEIRGRVGGRLPEDMLLGMVDPQDPLTYLPVVGPAAKAGMRMAKGASLAVKNAANASRAARGLETLYPEANSLADLGIKDDLIRVVPGVMGDQKTADMLAEQMRERAMSAPKEVPVEYPSTKTLEIPSHVRSAGRLSPDSPDLMETAGYLEREYRGLGTAVPSQKALDIASKAEGPLTMRMIMEDIAEQAQASQAKGISLPAEAQIKPTAEAVQNFIMEYGSAAPGKQTMSASKAMDFGRSYIAPASTDHPSFTTARIMQALNTGELNENQLLAILNSNLYMPNITPSGRKELNKLRIALARTISRDGEVKTPLLMPEGVVLPEDATQFIPRTSVINSHSKLDAHQNLAALSPSTGAQMALDPRMVSVPVRRRGEAATVMLGYNPERGVVKPTSWGELISPDRENRANSLVDMLELYGVENVMRDPTNITGNIPYGNANFAPQSLRKYQDETMWDGYYRSKKMGEKKMKGGK